MNTKAHTSKTIEGEFTDIRPEKFLLQLYHTIIKNGVNHTRLQQFANLIDNKVGGLKVSDINTIRVQWLSLISLLYQYGYAEEAKLFLSIEGVEKNDIDILIGKINFVFWVWNITMSKYIKGFLLSWNINAIPILQTQPSWSILHFLVNVYLNNKTYPKHIILWLIEHVLWIPWININSLDMDWCSILDNLYYEPRNCNTQYIEEYLENNWATYCSVKVKEIKKNVDKYRNKTQEIVTPWFLITT